jgi:hypothetical protein
MSSALLALVLSGPLLLVQSGYASTVETRVYVTQSDSWETGGGVSGNKDILLGGSGGGARPQTAEIIKTFQKRCTPVTLTNDRDLADFVVLLDHEGGKLFFQRDNKVVVFNKEGDAIYSDSTRSLGNAVKGACRAIAEEVPGLRPRP